MGFWDDAVSNFELGVAGIADLALGVVGVDSAIAAGVYAQQTGQTSEEVERLRRAAERATQQGALQRAAGRTAQQIADAAGQVLEKQERKLLVALGLAAVALTASAVIVVAV